MSLPTAHTGTLGFHRTEHSLPYRALRVLLGSFAHLCHLLSLILVIPVSLTVIIPLLPFPRYRRPITNIALRTYLRFFTKVLLPALRICRIVEISGQENLPTSPAVYVANHRSAIDALMLLPMLPSTSPIIKDKHSRKPGYACLVKFFDFVSVNAGSLADLQISMLKCRTLVADGISLLVFPEGRRVSSGALMPFNDFAFRFALKQNLPIIPVIIHSNHPFLNRQAGSYFPMEFVEYRIRFLPPVATGTKRDSDELIDAVHRTMQEQLDKLDQAFLEPISTEDAP